jgi:F0F1-type ATP synthase gamma subunit
VATYEIHKKLYILLTSDRGLAGSYHNQLFKAFLEEVKETYINRLKFNIDI